jgi:hypothetical protein
MIASRMLSEIWSAILSGCPSVTDSEVKSTRLLMFFLLTIKTPSFLSKEGEILPFSHLLDPCGIYRNWHRLAQANGCRAVIGPVPQASLDKS